MISKNLPQKIVRVIKMRDKTLTVEEIRQKKHPRYEKKFRVTKHFQVHCSNPDIHKGDLIVIISSKPISAKKRWRFIKKVEIKGKIK